MDYFDLLHQAQMNNKSSGTGGIPCYKATFSAPKKMERSRVSNDNIKKFLARKDEEEKQRLLEAKKKKEELLALRSLDKKAQKRVQVMLKRTKSANKSVMEDAIDNYNTKDTLEGPQQCDEDDYGYVSQEASAFYEKMMAKYDKDPTENLKQMNREVKDLKAAKDRVKAALDREAEEQLLPRKRKRKHKDSEQDDDKQEDPEEEVSSMDKSKDNHERDTEKESEREKPKKIPKKMPPPVDFFELMKIAAKKQHEPILIEKKKVEEPERPLTKKEKLERQRELERKNRKNNPKSQSEGKSPSDKQSSSDRQSFKEEPSSKSQPKNKITYDSPESSKSKGIIKNKSDSNSISSLPSFKKKDVKFSHAVEKSPLPNKNAPLNSSKEKVNNSSDLKSKALSNGMSKPHQSINKSNIPKTDPSKEDPQCNEDLSDLDKQIALLMKKKQMLMNASKVQKPSPASQSSKDLIQRPSTLSGGNKPTLPSKKPSSDLRESQSSKSVDKDRLISKSSNDKDKVVSKNGLDKDRAPSKPGEKMPIKSVSKGPDLKYGSSAPQRKFSPPRYGPPARQPMKKKPQNKRVIDSESEYDSEMDEFIDDGPDDYSMDYSKHIKEIFGYDKSRYAHIDEDECEESSFRTQMIEERRSAKIGLMEDLEDIQREKEEKAQKAMMKKKRMSMGR